MKNLKLSFISNLLMVVVAIFALSSCGDDVAPVTISPDIEFLDGTDYVTVSAVIEPDAIFNLSVQGTKGDGLLNTITIYEDGIKIDDFANRITIAGTAAASNPILIVDETDKQGFTWDISIKGHNVGTKTYSIELAADDGLVDEASIEIAITSGPLTLTLVDESGFISTDAIFDLPGDFTVKVDATRGDSPLSSLTVLENGVEITELSRIKYNGVEFDANPLPLIEDEVNGIVWEITVASQTTTGSTSEFTFEIQDDSGETANEAINITIQASGTPVSVQTGILLNSAGPAGTGGLDLINGVGTGSSDAAAHIRDQGIDGALPLDQNWKRKIAGVNGSTMRTADPSLGETFSFSNVSTKEQITTAFDSSASFEFVESDVVEVNDVFLVQNGGNTFMLLVTAVTPTTSDNGDNYEFSIKY